jgi:flagellar basal-body rod modification protein FlgD
MSTSPVSGSAATDPTKQASATAAAGQLGQNEFLKLMVAQLKNQDPMKPMDPAAFLSQLAQFSTVTGIQGMQTSIADLSSSLKSAQVLQGSSLVGHTVLSATTDAALGTTDTITGAVQAPSGTSVIDIKVTDASGALVRQLQVAPQAGYTQVTWNGTADNGTRAPAGTYHVQAVAEIGGKAQSLEMMLQQKVDSVTIDGTAAGGLILNTTSGTVALGDVRRVM